MANVIKHKRGSGSDPSASDLVVGEVAIRTDVGKLFTKMDNGSVAEIAGGGSDIAINTLSSSSGTGGGSATFNGSAYRFTLSAPPSVSAQQLLVSINGVIQKPVAGTGQPSEGFSVDGNDIILGDAPATGADFFIVTFKSLGVSEPADNSVTSAKIVDGAIVNADINASAAIAGTKISPDFGSQNIVTTGGLTIDTSTLHVDASNNRVGIGTTSPSTGLEIKSGMNSDGLSILKGSNSSVFLGHNGSGDEGLLHLKDGGTTTIQIYGETGQSSFFNAGNVGIGTTSPSAPLTFGKAVYGEPTSEDFFRIKFNDTGGINNDVGIGQPDASSLAFNTISNGTIRFYNGTDDEMMRLDASGRLGIGTTSPSANLESEGNVSSTTQFSGFQGLRIQNANGAAHGVTADINFVAGTGSGNRGAVIGVEYTSTASGNDLYFATNPNSVSSNDTPIERMRIDSSGNVGIGTLTMNHPLDVQGANNTTFDHVAVLSLKGTDAYNSGNAGSGINFGGRYNSSGATSTFAQISGIKEDTGNGTYDGALTFGVRNDTEGVNIERMRIDSAGNVEIMQSKKLVFVYAGGSTHRASISGDSSDNFKITTGSSDTERFNINSSGKTKMTQDHSGQTEPILHLDRPSAAANAAVDMIHFDSGNQGRGKVLSSSSDSGSPSFAARSDYRIKENIRNYTGGWDNIKAVPVKLFDVKTDGSKDQKGWIAHELQAVLPDLVQGTKDAVVTQAMVDNEESDEKELGNPIYQTVSMGLFMPDVISALQTAIAKIETLETKVTALEAG